MKEKIKNIILREYEIAKMNILLVVNVTKIQIKDLFNRIKPNKFIENRKRKVQYVVPGVKIVGKIEKAEIEEIHDAFVSFVVNEYFKDHNCHVFKFKGDTYIRLDEPKKTDYIDISEIYGLAQKKSNKTFVEALNRSNYKNN